jgi:Icc-related predicted phosphoesterase
MRACHISDCHDVYQDLNLLVPQDIDILFITGDMTYRGKESEMEVFMSDLIKLKRRINHIVCVFGNHEVGCQGREQEYKIKFASIGVVLLNHESIEINGIKIFGSPYTPEFFDWAFMYDPKDAEAIWNLIPLDTQVLLTHGPAYKILDKCPNGNVGCPTLREKVLSGLPVLKYHLFGHLHESYGTIETRGILFSNGSIMNGRYKFINKPFCFDMN